MYWDITIVTKIFSRFFTLCTELPLTDVFQNLPIFDFQVLERIIALTSLYFLRHDYFKPANLATFFFQTRVVIGNYTKGKIDPVVFAHGRSRGTRKHCDLLRLFTFHKF
jgi:hypothetical protein